MNTAVFLVVVLAVSLIVLMVVMQPKSKRHSSKRRAHSAKPLDREFVSRKWQTIELMTQSGGSGLRDAVSEADKLLDYALKHSGARGETMGERLKSSTNRFSDLDAIWDAHKLRNVLAHEADFDLVPSQAREAIASFRQGLKDVGAL